MGVGIELQYDNDGILEKSYRPTDLEGKILKAQIENLYYEDLSQVEMISYHPLDNITYIDDCIVCVFNCSPSVEVLNRFNANTNEKYFDYYNIKYPLGKNRRPYLKVYSKVSELYPLPKLPVGTRLASHLFGFGRHYGLPSIKNLRDIYFFNNDQNSMISTYGEKLYPLIDEDFVPKTRCYGLTYNVETYEILKIKRYVFPHDPEINNLQSL